MDGRSASPQGRNQRPSFLPSCNSLADKDKRLHHGRMGLDGEVSEIHFAQGQWNHCETSQGRQKTMKAMLPVMHRPSREAAFKK